MATKKPATKKRSSKKRTPTSPTSALKGGAEYETWLTPEDVARAEQAKSSKPGTLEIVDPLMSALRDGRISAINFLSDICSEDGGEGLAIEERLSAALALMQYRPRIVRRTVSK